jgi:hypothetical protein
MKKSEINGLQPLTAAEFATAVSDQMRFIPRLAQIAPGTYTIEHSSTTTGRGNSAITTNEVTFYNVSYTRNDGSEGHYIAVALVENEELIPISALATRAIVDASNNNILSRGFFDNTEDLAACQATLNASSMQFVLTHQRNARWAEGRRRGTRPVVTPVV